MSSHHLRWLLFYSNLMAFTGSIFDISIDGIYLKSINVILEYAPVNKGAMLDP